jgi:hypothetical protein
MDEIADAFAAAGVPDAFHRGAAELYRRLDRFKDTPDPPSLAELVDAVTESAARGDEGERSEPRSLASE